MAFPAQFRKKLLSVQEKEGLTNIEVATRFGVGKASISRWKVNPNPVFKRNRPAQKIDMEALKKDVEEHPDHFNYERAERFSVSESGIRNALKRLGVSRKKKTLKHPKADEVLREEFKIKIEKYKSEGREIVYVDESGFAHESTRSHGYAAVGERCFSKFDWGAKGRTNVIGALLNGLLVTVALFAFNVDANTFFAWMTQDLLPKVPKNSVIVMDNAKFHKRKDISESILSAGCIPEFLPTYSPDLNPIEHSWAQVKSIRNKFRYSVDELFVSPDFGNLLIVR